MKQPDSSIDWSVLAGRCTAALCASALMVGSAAAASFRIDFYEGVMTGDFQTTDWDGDGLVDHSGIFTTNGASPTAVTAFDVTIAGERYNQLYTEAFPGAPMFNASSALWSIDWIRGFVFDEQFSTPGDTVTVLQMEAFGIGDGSGNWSYYGTWALSPCNTQVSCGGGQLRGSYKITELNAVPAPATLSLAGLGLLAAWRRRPR